VLRCRMILLGEAHKLLVAAGKVPLSPNTGLPMDTDLKPNHLARRLIAMIKEGSLPQFKPPAVGK
jgi:hypothetical protein